MMRAHLLSTAVCLAVAMTSGCTYVSLTHFYDRVPAATPIAIDPIGGYLLLYWIDDQGVACHGSPGISGQPGPAALAGARPAAIQDAIANAAITPSRLAEYQLISYNLGDYSKTNASGLHYFEFEQPSMARPWQQPGISRLGVAPLFRTAGDRPRQPTADALSGLRMGPSGLRARRVLRDRRPAAGTAVAASRPMPPQGASCLERRSRERPVRVLREASARGLAVRLFLTRLPLKTPCSS